MPLTPEQRDALWEPNGTPTSGLRIVSARPGTGKTTTLTEYCMAAGEGWSKRYAPWQGMALISYTNVAKDELEAKIRKVGRANQLLANPHFVGTIDAFMNQYIFLPFGASYMGFEGGRPRLVGEPYGQWNPWGLVEKAIDGAYSPAFFDCYTLGLGGLPVTGTTTSRKIGAKFVPVPTKDASKILKLKEHVWKNGYATQADANYIAHAVLTRSPRLTRALVGRFPMLVVDEAQDMTELQHALVDHLKIAGLKHIVLIGDEYQAIYEWNTARPQLFTDKSADTVTWTPKAISRTFRCSPAICGALTKMANDGAAILPDPTGKNSGYEKPVQVRSYDDSDEQLALEQAIDDAASILTERKAHDNNPASVKTIAVVARSREGVCRLEGGLLCGSAQPKQPVTWGHRLTKDYLRVVFHLQHRDMYEAFNAYETLLFNAGDCRSKSAMRAELGQRWGLDSSNVLGYRVEVFGDLKKMAATIPTNDGVSISACAASCRVTLKGISKADLAGIEKDCRSFEDAQKRDQDRTLSSVFAARDERVTYQHPKYDDVRIVFSTVHGVKGETFDGVVFHTRARTGSCGCSRKGCMWAGILQHDLAQCEGKRIAYVALSRAAQLLFILAPTKVAGSWTALTQGAETAP